MAVKKFEDLEFSDDYMFKKVMMDEEICKGVIERLLHVQVDHLDYPEVEKQLNPYYGTKGIRLDVYVKDSDRIFDLEIQSYKENALGERTRFYQSLLDTDSLMKGSTYDELKESYIVFICLENPFDNLKEEDLIPRYEFVSLCKEKPSIRLNDKSTKVIYNASRYKKEKDPVVRAFLKFVYENKSEDSFTKNIQNRVDDVKRAEINKEEYLNMNIHDYDVLRRGRDEGIAIGIERGKDESRLETAKKLLQMNVCTIEQIASATELSIEEVKALAEEAKSN
ncbi:MAG: Rpn family recombination-promoting nuclease/putative transposase [Treponema sp.]|nr:Rpn family recombination-promoting nuclease/putative transposase [Treponema sp.]